MLLAASESAATKKPRLRLTMRRSSSVRPFGSFQSWISRLMLISCGIQWLAQAAMYFSQAHLYLKGTSWLTSALELMTCLSSTVTRRRAALGTGAGSRVTRGSGAGVLSGARFSKLRSIFLVVLVGRREVVELRPVVARQRPLDGQALRFGGKRHLVHGDVQV